MEEDNNNTTTTTSTSTRRSSLNRRRLNKDTISSSSSSSRRFDNNKIIKKIKTHHNHNQSEETQENTNNKMNNINGKKKRLLDPCNPIGYIIGRQINDRIDWSKKLIDNRLEYAENLFRKDLYSHFGCVNAIEFSTKGDLLASGGDDKRVLLWNVEKAIQGYGEPTVMKAQHMSNIFCLGYNNSTSKIFSAGNDDQVIVHDLQTTDAVNFFRHEKPVYGLSVHPHNDNIFASACDDGRILIYDIRGTVSSPESFFCVAQHKDPFHSVMYNPVESTMLATANAKEGVSMWDVRKPLKPVLRYGSEGSAQSCINVRFNEAGTTLLALRRRLPPVLYSVKSAAHLCQFDHPGYYNSCTMKSCSFAGRNDDYILSGSDDFNLYMWKIPTDDSVKWIDSAHMILRGHRSIVNQVRYNLTSCLLASSGVEKVIKLWSPFPLSQKCLGGLRRDDDKDEKQRRVYTHDEYIGLVLRSGQVMTHDYSHQSTDEDQRMMAFFDSLVQREIESWSSEDVPTPQSPSDPENNNGTDRNNQSDSEDSTASDHQLMRCFLGSTLNSTHATPTVPERSLESPNRITRLIANRREKLMRLAALEGGNSQTKTNGSTSSTPTTSTTSTSTTTTPASTYAASITAATESGSGSEFEREISKRCNKACSKINNAQKSKVTKRKHSSFRASLRRCRARRKLTELRNDSDSDPDETTERNNQTVDAPQPSTSSGLSSSTRRPRYTAATITESRRNRSRSTSSSNSSNSASGDDNNSPMTNKTPNGNASKDHKRRHTAVTKSDSDSSSKEHQPPPKLRKPTRIKSKINTTNSSASSMMTTRRVKSKRQKINDDNEQEQQDQQQRCNGKSTSSTTIALTNGSTPTRSSTRNQIQATSDSGITSGLSATSTSAEKSATKLQTTTEQGSDHERITKNFEWFQKKIDVARRGYRKRVMLPSPSSSDSSDD